MQPGPKTILYVDVTGRGGGSSSSLRILLGDIDRRRYTPTLLFGDRGHARSWQPERVYEAWFAGLHNYDFFPAGFRPRWIYHLLKFLVHIPFDLTFAFLLLRKMKPSLVHINGGQLLVFGIVSRMLGYPVVWHIRELVSGNPVGRIQDRVYAWSSDRIIAVSRAVANRIPRSQVRLAVIPNAVSGVHIPPDRVAEFRTTMGIGQADFVVTLLANRISVSKGYLFFADVAEQILNEPGIVLMLAGEYADEVGPATKRMIRKIIGRLPGGSEEVVIRNRWRTLITGHRVLFPGILPPELAIASSDIVVCPNTVAEPFGRSVIEANMQSKPVIASDLPAFNELIEHEVTGWLLPVESHIWAETILKLYFDRTLLLNIGKEAGHRGERFLSARHAGEIMKIYEEVLRANPNKHIPNP